MNDIGYGTWPLGGRAYGPVATDAAAAALNAALDAGVRLFDTADIYGDGRAETLVGAAIRSAPDAIVISKCGYQDEVSGQQDFTERHLFRSVDASLKRLGRRQIDVYLLHSPPSAVLDDKRVLGTMEGFVTSGIVGRVGVSLRNVNDWPRALRWSAVSVIEVIFNLVDQRPIDTGLIEAAQRQGIAIIARVPLCFGLLTRTRSSASFDSGDQRSRWSAAQLQRWLDAADQFRFLERVDRTRAQAALAFCLAYPHVSPIPGMKTVDQVRHNLAARQSHLRITHSELARIRDTWCGLRDVPPT